MLPLQTSDFDFELPEDLIAQEPAARREDSRLLVLNRDAPSIDHKSMGDFPRLIRPGDLLVVNASKVIPARLQAIKPGTGGRFEILLGEPLSGLIWRCLVRPAKRLRPGCGLQLIAASQLPSPITATLLAKNQDGTCDLEFRGTHNFLQAIEEIGQVPLPPYIRRKNAANADQDRLRYQTVYARDPGSVAAPTAGLHFSEELIQSVLAAGAGMASVILHVGIGTFAPVKASRIEEHRMHEERFDLPEETAARIRQTKAQGGRIIAVGTTTLRVLESAARFDPDHLRACSGRTALFIHPPFQFRVVDALLTNFHLPKSSLLMLVSAFADNGGMQGLARIQAAYAEAVRLRYRFFSYGDAMFIS